MGLTVGLELQGTFALAMSLVLHSEVSKLLAMGQSSIGRQSDVACSFADANSTVVWEELEIVPGREQAMDQQHWTLALRHPSSV